VQYRKFDAEYMEFVTRTAKPGDVPIRGHTPGKSFRNEFPVSTLASDRIIFPVAGVTADIPQQEYPIKIDHIYQRWNDYGLALLREADGLGSSAGATAELKQAEDIFLYLDKGFGYIDVRANLARIYLAEGRLEEAAAALRKAAAVGKPMFYTEPVYAPWALNWVAGLIHQQQGRLDEAIGNFRSVLNDRNQPMVNRGFDFQPDYIVRNELGLVLWERGKSATGTDRERFLRDAVDQFEAALKFDTENATAHYNLAQLYQQLNESERAENHRQLHVRYKPDDNARDRAARLARLRDPAANHAAEPIAIYPLRSPTSSGPTVTPPLSSLKVEDRR
jgi:tetratricopeptide (TPR) repeat protein